MSQLHPEMRKIIDLVDADLRERGWADLHSAGAEAAREFLESWVPPEQDRPPIYQTEDRPMPGPAGDIPVRIFRPRETSETMPVLVWYHGGGWVLGSLDLSEVNCRQLANDADCVVVSVDYRALFQVSKYRWPVSLSLSLSLSFLSLNRFCTPLRASPVKGGSNP